MPQLVPVALFGWVIVMTLLHYLLPRVSPQRLILVAIIGGTLFLPVTSYSMVGYLTFNKETAISLSAGLGILLRNRRATSVRKLCWYDAPILIWCLVPAITLVANTNMPPKDAITDALSRLLTWGVPYLLGRSFFGTFKLLNFLAWGTFIGGLVYVPFCVFEIRMSPSLNTFVYGYSQHSFLQTIRSDGGFRPMVFMNHGLMLGMWMSAASLAGVWLWQTRAVRHLFGVHIGYAVLLLVVTTVWCRSSGAAVLLLIGVVTLYVTAWSGVSALLPILIMCPVLYLLARTAGGWDGQSAVRLVNMVMGSNRADSLAFRMINENLLARRAAERFWFGWGAGFDWLSNDNGASIPDGMWTVAYGLSGFVGLTGYLGSILLPAWAMYKRVAAQFWKHPAGAGGVALAVWLPLVAIDNVLNAMPNAVFTLMAGAMVGAAVSARADLPKEQTASESPTPK